MILTTKNKPVIPRKNDKKEDIIKLRSFVNILKNPRMKNYFQTYGQKPLFTKKFIDKAFLKAYITAEERKMLYKNNLVKNTNGSIAKLKSDMVKFNAKYPNIYNRMKEYLLNRFGFIEKHGYKIEIRIRRIK